MPIQSSNRKKLMLVLVLLAVAAVVGAMNWRAAHTLPQDYYFDLNTGKLFKADLGLNATVAAPSGGVGVRAYVVSCSKSCGETDLQIAYIEKYTEETQPLLAKTFTDFNEEQARLAKVEKGLLVAAPVAAGHGEPQWVDNASSAGEKLVAAVGKLCSGDPARRCKP